MPPVQFGASNREGHQPFGPTERTFFPAGDLTTPEIDLVFQCRMGASRARSARWSAQEATLSHRDADDVIRETWVVTMYPMIAPDAAAAAFEMACLLSTVVAALMCYFLGARC